MNILDIEAQLAKDYNYKPLQEEMSDKYRALFLENIPLNLNVGGSNTPLYTKKDTIFCQGYTRIVIGDYGAFIEIAPNQIYKAKLIVKPGQEYRIDDPKYSKNVKYHWYTVNDGSNIKIYHQQRRVAYADYLPGMYYVSPHEVR